MGSIQIPHNYTPRPYQLPFLQAMDSGFTRAVMVWHRRSGKDKTLINFTIKKMMERVGVYYYLFPTYQQGKKILWKGIDKTGFRFMDHFPPEIVYAINNSEMSVTLIHPTDRNPDGSPKPGSIFQIVGTDNIDSVVGTNPIGCVFSEYSLQDPSAWDFLRPILAENDGWAVFNYTPRGENHGWELYEMARKNPDKWFCQLLTVKDTGVIKEEVLEQERSEIISKDGNDALFQQEYMCSFKVPIQGAYYGTLLMQARETKRIGNVPYDPMIPVHTYWDLGVGDSTAIWFAQFVGPEIRLIDYYETSGEGLPHYIKILQDKGYVYGTHWAPHDIQVRELSSGKSRIEIASSLGINFEIAPQLSLDDGINATRLLLPKCWFDEEKCHRGINALISYHKVFDEKNKIYKDKPAHDWSSHGSDAFRMLAVSYRGSEVDDGEIPDDTELINSWY